VEQSEELLRVGRKLSAVLESLSVGVLIADVDGRVCQSTEEVSRILKSTELVKADAYGEMLGWWGSDGQVLKESGGPLSRALHDGSQSHSERIQVKCFDGSSKSVVVSASPLRGLEGAIVGAVVLIQDLSEAERIEEDLEERITRLIATGVELEESAVR
jgi:PAS domain-containing protein